MGQSPSPLDKSSGQMKAIFMDEQFIAMIKGQEAGDKAADVCPLSGNHSEANFSATNVRKGPLADTGSHRPNGSFVRTPTFELI
jgi:hypothetical protein